jgi:hypothetical protein
MYLLSPAAVVEVVEIPTLESANPAVVAVVVVDKSELSPRRR